MRVLADIVASKEREIASLALVTRSLSTRTAIDVAGRLQRRAGSPLNLIAEIKLRSPSAGRLSRVLSPRDRGMAYAECGAAMISVLCDGPFFDGSWTDVEELRGRLDASKLEVPILAKEFVLGERQIQEARDRGADAILLIARIVSPERLQELADCARAENIEPVIEVVDELELAAALAAKARVIGVNARDLDTLVIDVERTARTLSNIPSHVVAVHLSGVREREDVVRVSEGRADAVLMGEALMRDDDPRPRLRALVDAARG